MEAVGIVLPYVTEQDADEFMYGKNASVMEIAGVLRSIDIVLSNMYNSGITDIMYCTKDSDDSYIRQSNWKKCIITDDITGFLNRTDKKYVVLSYDNSVYRMDFEDVLSYHINNNAEITVVKGNDGVFPGVTIINKDKLLQLICAYSHEIINNVIFCTNLIESDNEMLYNIIHKGGIFVYNVLSYCNRIVNVTSYYNLNMDFLKRDVRNCFFKEKPAMYSMMRDIPPAKYNEASIVRNSIVSNGCIINGVVDSSVIFTEVYIGNNSKIKNSIILDDVYIGDNAYMENCIVDRHSTIRANTTYIGETDNIRILLAAT